MKVLVEVLQEKKDEFGESYWETMKSKTVEIKDKNITKAQTKLQELKSANNGKKIRILEYHNDDPDEVRLPCKVLLES